MFKGLEVGDSCYYIKEKHYSKEVDVIFNKKAYINTKNLNVGIHALINVHEYHCIAIRMRCWLMDT
jgi:hypothetical protein